jgi:hypothetical protein
MSSVSILPFSPVGANVSTACTTTAAYAALPARMNTTNPLNIRVVNNATDVVYVRMVQDDADVVDNTYSPVLGGTERIFSWDSSAIGVSLVLASGTGDVDCQLGIGV